MLLTPVGTVQLPAALTPLTQSAAIAGPAAPKQRSAAALACLKDLIVLLSCVETYKYFSFQTLPKAS
jgi:hypothetical protein